MLQIPINEIKIKKKNQKTQKRKKGKNEGRKKGSLKPRCLDSPASPLVTLL